MSNKVDEIREQMGKLHKKYNPFTDFNFENDLSIEEYVYSLGDWFKGLLNQFKSLEDKANEVTEEAASSASAAADSAEAAADSAEAAADSAEAAADSAEAAAESERNAKDYADNIKVKMYRYTELETTSFTTPNGTSWNKTEVSFTPQLNGLLTVAVNNTDGYPTSIALCTQGYASYPDGSIYLQNSLPLQNKGYFFLRAKRGETLYLYVKWSKAGAGTVTVESLGVPSTVEYTPDA